MSSSGTDEEATDSPARRAFLRGLLVSVAFGAVFGGAELLTLIAKGQTITRARWLEPVLGGLAVGFIAAPAAFIELRARRFAPGLRRDVLAGAVIGLVAVPLMILAALQTIYTLNVIEEHDLRAAWRMVRVAARALRSDRADLLRMAGGAVLFGGLSFLRLRDLRVERQMLALLAGGGLVALPVYAYAPPPYIDVGVIGLIFAGAAFVAPLVGAAADALEERITAWLRGEPAEPTPPLRARARALLAERWLALLLVVVLTLAVGAAGFVVADRKKDFSPTGRALEEFEALASGALSPAEAARITSRLTAADFRVRRRLGTQDLVAVTVRREKFPAGLSFIVFGHARVDDGVGYIGTLQYSSPRQDDERGIWAALGGTLPPGEHAVAFLASASVLSAKTPGKVIETGPLERRWTIDVVAEPSVIRLDDKVSLEGASVALEDYDTDWVRLRVENLPLPMSGHFEVYDEAGRLLARHSVFAHAKGKSAYFWAHIGPGLAKGHHALTAKVVPHPDPVLAHDAEIETILGVTLEAKCDFERD